MSLSPVILAPGGPIRSVKSHGNIKQTDKYKLNVDVKISGNKTNTMRTSHIDDLLTSTRLLSISHNDQAKSGAFLMAVNINAYYTEPVVLCRV